MENYTKYTPLILIVLFITGITFLVQYPFNAFSWNIWMRHFMAGFFIVFSFFKILDLKGFVNTYVLYDFITKKYKAWGYIYPFIELSLGIAYLIENVSNIINFITIILLSISITGVIKSVISKNKIKCACLGNIFNLPMSIVTIIENLIMIFMAICMLVMN
ncbi:MAG: hypothetical protein MI674_02325 [Cytophagales bacterium]|nr:hypothetical protein [Cytophagales bacterium]